MDASCIYPLLREEFWHNYITLNSGLVRQWLSKIIIHNKALGSDPGHPFSMETEITKITMCTWIIDFNGLTIWSGSWNEEKLEDGR